MHNEYVTIYMIIAGIIATLITLISILLDELRTIKKRLNSIEKLFDPKILKQSTVRN